MRGDEVEQGSKTLTQLEAIVKTTTLEPKPQPVEEIPRGTFHGDDQLPAGTFHNK